MKQNEKDNINEVKNNLHYLSILKGQEKNVDCTSDAM